MGDYSYHNCGKVPKEIQVVEFSDGAWLLRDNYEGNEMTGQIIYCPYCGINLVQGTEITE